MRKWVVLLVFFVLGNGIHASDEAAPAQDGHAHSRHHIEATLGIAFNDGETAKFSGLEYEYRFNRKLGAGAFVDSTFSGFELSAFGAVVNYHPSGPWKVIAGLGVESKIGDDKNKALYRVGAAYEFHIGNGTISPLIVYDFLEDSKDVLYVGCALGFGF